MSTYTFGLSGKGKVTADGRWNLGSDIIVMTSDIDIKASSGANYSTLKSNLKELSLYGDWLAKENLTLKLAYLRSEEHTSELQSRPHLVCRLLLEKKKKKTNNTIE